MKNSVLVMKGLKISMIGLIVFAVMYMIYLVTQMSATYPPLKTYDYALTDDELQKDLANAVSNNPAWTLVSLYSVGVKGNRRHHCELYKRTPSDSLTFSIFYQKTNRLLDKSTHSEIGLVQVWDNIQWKGGYKMNDPEVEKLVKIFEEDIISELKMKTSR